MGRPKTATNILDARGAFKKNPDRARPKEPKPKGKFRKTPPTHLTDLQKTCWKEIVKQVPPGVLTEADQVTFEIIVILFAEFRLKGAKMSAAHLTRMTAMMGRIGLDPAGRAGLVVDTGDKPNNTGFDDF